MIIEKRDERNIDRSSDNIRSSENEPDVNRFGE